MRHLRAALVVAAIQATYAILGSAATAQRLATLPPRTRPNVDPLGTALGAGGVLLALVLYATLGRRIARAGDRRREAIVAGIVAGAIAGAFGAAAQALALSTYLAGVLAGYGVPEAFLATVLAAYALIAAGLSTAFGAVVTWLAFSLFREK